jgi:hypothetical protein
MTFRPKGYIQNLNLAKNSGQTIDIRKLKRESVVYLKYKWVKAAYINEDVGSNFDASFRYVE